jgi:hypothetical protein
VTAQPMTAAAAARSRDASGRVTAPVRIEVKFGHARERGGYRHYCDSLAEAAGFLASPSFRQTAHLVKSVTIVVQDPDLGPEIATPTRHYDPLRGSA